MEARRRSGAASSGSAELADVGAGGEDPLATGDDDGAGRIGGRARRPPRARLAQQRLRQGVDLRVVERDDGHAVVASLEQHQSSCRIMTAAIAATRTSDGRPTRLGTDAVQHLVGGGPRVDAAVRARRACSSSQRSPLHSSRARCSSRRATIVAQLLAQPELAALRRARRSSVMWSRWSSDGVPQLGARPRPVVPTVGRIGGRHVVGAGRTRSSICSRSRRVSSTPLRSALLMTKTSAISISPALLACTRRPSRG